jgi:hypothetical protein
VVYVLTVGACSSTSQPTCLANGEYTVTLALQDDAGATACQVYAGSTAVVSIANLHAPAPGELTGSATVAVTRSGSTQPEQWSDCSHSTYSCQEIDVACTLGSNDLSFILSNRGDGVLGVAQYAANHGSQCFDNYDVTVVGQPK